MTGYDHLLFLLSLVLIASRFKDALKIVTAFTIAHSITLFLVAIGPHSGHLVLGRSVDCGDDLLCGRGKYVCSKGEMAVDIDSHIWPDSRYGLRRGFG